MRYINRLAIVFTVLLLGGCASVAQFDTADAIISSPNDSREYRHLTLVNGLQVMLVRETGEKTAAASLSIAVGSRFDPPQRQGLAHFLEHMLFLGTQKYPNANGYQQFISAHGGSHNAYTSFEQTNYYFDIQNAYLDQALDRFADFFVSPLFNAEYVEREINAIEAEYRSRYLDEGRRIIDATRSVANPGHPFSQFSVGSLSSLAGEDLRQQLLDFYQNQYSADRMRLVVVGDYPLSVLEQMVTSRFSSIDNRYLGDVSIEQQLFERLPAMLAVETKKSMQQLVFSFPIQDVKAYATLKPLDYIANLLGDEGEGSLLSVLKRRSLVETLSAGVGLHYNGGALFQISMNLTEQGVYEVDEIGQALFAVIDNIRSELRDQPARAKRRYREQQQLANIAFRFYEHASPLNTAVHIANNMQFYPIGSAVYGPYQYEKFSPHAIELFLSRLDQGNVLVTLAGDKLTEHFNMQSTSERYAVNYAYRELPSDWLVNRQQAEGGIYSLLALPPDNPFIPNDFSIYRDSIDAGDGLTIGSADIPELFSDEQGYRLWIKNDHYFVQPKLTLDIGLLLPESDRTLTTQVISQLLSLAVADSLTEQLYPAFLAGYSANFRPHLRGFTVSVNGYSDSAVKVAEQILGGISTFSLTDERFEGLRARLTQRWRYAEKSNALSLLEQQLPMALLRNQWSFTQMLNELEGITKQQLEAFARSLSSRVYIESLLHGNFNQAMLDQVQHLIAGFSTCDCNYSDGAEYAVTENVVNGKLRPATLRSAQDNALLWYFPAAATTAVDSVSLMLAREILHPKFYSELRTQAQLGYLVGVDHRAWYQRSGLTFWVQSPQASVDELHAAVNQFIGKHLQQGIATKPEFEKYRAALIVDLAKDDSDLVARSRRYWYSLALSDTAFTRKSMLLEAARALDYVSWQERLSAMLSPTGASLMLTASPR